MARKPLGCRRSARAEAPEEGNGVGAERLDRVAALLERDDRHPQARDRGADASVVIRPEREVADRVGVVGVEAERHDERRIGVEAADGGERLFQGGEVGVAIGPGRQWQVEGGALAGIGATLGREAGVVGVDPARVAMQADVEDVSAIPKICCVPLPWWKSMSRIAARSAPRATTASATMAALLKKQ